MGQWWLLWIGHNQEIVLKLSISSWFLTLNLFSSDEPIAESCPLCMLIGEISFKCGDRGILTALQQKFYGCQRLSGGIGNPLTNSSKGFGNFSKCTFLFEVCQNQGCQYLLILCQRVLITPWSSWQRVLDNLQRHLPKGCPLNNESDQHFAISSDNFKVKLTILKAINSLKNYRGSSPNQVLSVYAICSSLQSRETVFLSTNLDISSIPPSQV